MNSIFDFLFDIVLEVIIKIADKVRENRPEHSSEGTVAEWILAIAAFGAMIGYCLLRIFGEDNYGQPGMKFLGIFLLTLAAVLAGAFLIHWIHRRQRKTRDSENKLR